MFEPSFLAIIFLVFRLQKRVDEKHGPSVMASDFGNWFRIIAGDVESPPLLPLLLLLLLSLPLERKATCLSYSCAVGRRHSATCRCDALF